MKDEKGHGSDPRGAHSAGIDQVGKVPTTQEFRKMAADLGALRSQPNPDYQRIMQDSKVLDAASRAMAPGTHPLIEQSGSMQLGHITANRYYKSEGGMSGWVVANEEDRHHVTDPISNKVDAKAAMRDMYERTINAPGRRLPMG